jgi:hypothetical protein
MDWIWQNLFSTLVWEILLVIGGATILGYFKKKLPEHAPTLVYAICGGTCVAILIFTFTGRAIVSSKPPDPITPDNIEENIRTWAEHLGMNIGPANEPVASYFAHMLSLPNNPQAVEVFRAKEKPGYLQFKALVNISPENQGTFSKMSQSQVNRIMDGLNLEINRANLGCSVAMVTAVNDQLHKTILAGVGLQRAMPIKDLDEWLFAETFDQLTRGSGLVGSSIKLAMPLPPTSKPQTVVTLH